LHDHLADGRLLVRQEQCARAEPRRGRCSLAARMAAADHDDVEPGHGGGFKRGAGFPASGFMGEI